MAKQMYSENSSAAVYEIVRIMFISRRFSCECIVATKCIRLAAADNKATAARKSSARTRDDSIANGSKRE